MGASSAGRALNEIIKPTHRVEMILYASTWFEDEGNRVLRDDPEVIAASLRDEQKAA